MPAKDFYHDTFKNALVKDGWTITHDPYSIAVGRRTVFVDIGAERRLAAEKQGVKIAVEIKGFGGPSDIRELELALGQYALYRSLMTRYDPDRKLYLAAPEESYDETLRDPIARPVIADLAVPLIVFRPEEERIIQWDT
ncbi:MAG TPA: element excision factor XisH family protein [Isosphaeraceae bacterium]|jgi:hypothetical protein|nr:element excision factor XisH family protein [Isosphaeraceae bacterium]